MKRAQILFISTLVMLTVTAIVAFKPAGTVNQKIDITGTWKLDSYRYGSEAFSFTRVSTARPQIKLITGNSFMWAKYDSLSKRIVESAGGKYTLEGDYYSEAIDFGLGMDSYLGRECKFKITVAEGMFFMTGYLSDGYKIEEIWRKVE